MVSSIDDGHKMQCIICGDVIKHSEQDGCVPYGNDYVHGTCFRDKFGYEAARDDGMITDDLEDEFKRLEKEAYERQKRKEMVMRWAKFNLLPPNPFGARRVA